MLNQLRTQVTAYYMAMIGVLFGFVEDVATSLTPGEKAEAVRRVKAIIREVKALYALLEPHAERAADRVSESFDLKAANSAAEAIAVTIKPLVEQVTRLFEDADEPKEEEAAAL